MASAMPVRARIALIAAAVGVVAASSVAQDRSGKVRSWQVAWEARQAQETERREAERIRREYERRRAVAHARMRAQPDARYPSSPSADDFMCPVASNPEALGEFRLRTRERREDAFRRATGLPLQTGFSVHPVPKRAGTQAPSSGSLALSASPSPAGVFASASSASANDSGHMVPLFPSASDALGRQGFARVINHSDEAGEVTIEAFDDDGASYGPLTLSIDAGETVHFNSADLEEGNTDKGLSGSTGRGTGDWRLELGSDLDIEALSYIRTGDGFLTAMHDTVPRGDDGYRVEIFNPGSNANQQSRLRLVNPGDADATATITGTDDKGQSPGEGTTVAIPASASVTYTAAQLESGDAQGLSGSIGDGSGKWRLTVQSEEAILAMSLLSSPTGHLTNLSTAPDNENEGKHSVPLFPPASDGNGRQGFLRVVNHANEDGEVAIGAFDDTDRDYETLTLAIGANETKHFNSDDLELGNVDKGLAGSTGAGEGDWRLELTSDLDMEVLAYIRTTDGFLTAVHDLVPRSAKRHRVAVFNPGSNTNQVSVLRLVNSGDDSAEVTVTGLDDQGMSPGSDVVVIVPAGSATTLTALDLETGGPDFEGALGDGSGKWRLRVNANKPIVAMSLLSSPTGHLTNLSTAPQRGAGPSESAEEAFEALISPIVQSTCSNNCHVDGGISDYTPLVFVKDTEADHLTKNLKAFEDYLEETEDGASRILNKIQGALAHGGGSPVPAGTPEFAGFEQFLELLGAEVEDFVEVDLFERVTLEPQRRTLWRAAIVFAGRTPTEEEYALVEGGTENDLRRAILRLMQGPEFHEFLIRGANDRLLTDREDNVFGNAAGEFLVAFTETAYRLAEEAPEEFNRWRESAQYGAMRAPLELIAHVAENDLDYRQTLTADYIMANPHAAEAYGGTTDAFDDPNAVHEFRPVRIDDYYLGCEGKTIEDREFGRYVVERGPCPIIYPHAGLLNTEAFLKRYPSTATNRNRARARWTYYHFLGDDIEKSEDRTMDPAVLMDMNNPTMHNPACKACHERMDPVAGAFQNYGDLGFYRDQWGGRDALDSVYKNNRGVRKLVKAGSWKEPETLTWSLFMVPGANTLGVDFTNDFYDETTGDDGVVYLDRLRVLDADRESVASFEFEDEEIATASWGACGEVRDNPGGEGAHVALRNGATDSNCTTWFEVESAAGGDHEVRVVAWADRFDQYAEGYAQLAVSVDPYQIGDTWYRDMRKPGFGGDVVPDDEVDGSLQWLARRIVEQEAFAEAAVKFWWPAIMGAEVARQPEHGGDADYVALKLEADAQANEARRLAEGFRSGFVWSNQGAHNLKDLLVEIVMSDWFRADAAGPLDSDRIVALRNAGAKRLLTPEELARKTVALTGFEWGRQPGGRAYEIERGNELTSDRRLRLLYGGIDSDGITERSRETTPVMAGVAKSHATHSSCPIVFKEFYLLAKDERRLFSGIDETVTPVSEFSGTREVRADSWETRETLEIGGRLSAGSSRVGLSFSNDFADAAGDRNVRLYKLEVRNDDDEIVDSLDLVDLPPPGDSWEGCADRIVTDAGEGDHLKLHTTCDPGFAEVRIPADGDYTIAIIAWADQYGDESAQLDVAVESDTQRSAGASAIRTKIAELHGTLFGVVVGYSSPDVDAAFDLFVKVWERKRGSTDRMFGDAHCPWYTDYQYLDGILEDAVMDDGWDWDRVQPFMDEVLAEDPGRAARAWVAVLAYLLMYYRYLHL